MPRTLHKTPNELLTPCAIEGNVIAFLRPLNLIQSFFFISMYTIRDNFINSKSYFTIVLSILSIIVVIVVHTLRVSMADFDGDLFMYINTLFDAAYYIFGFMLNFYVCISYEHLNIILVLKIQELHKSQIFTRNTWRTLTRHNWIYICICSFFYVYEFICLLYIIMLSEYTLGYLLVTICQLILFAFDINMIYATQIIRLLRAALRQWIMDTKSITATKTNTQLKEKIFQKGLCLNRAFQVLASCPCVPSSLFPKSRHRKLLVPLNQRQDSAVIRKSAIVQAYRPTIEDDITTAAADLTSDEERMDCFWNGKLTAYATILDAYEMIKTAFQLLILFHCVETFIHGILYVYYITNFLQDYDKVGGIRLSYSAGLVVAWILKNIVIVSKLNIEFEQFYITVNDAMVNSLLKLTNNCSKQEKQMHKNVVRMSRISPKFAVCNLFALDATMPRRLLSLIATYTIVLLQFMLLHV